jgi:hypothetical protein
MAAGEWEEVGFVAVDSGHVWIGDPCYVLDPSVPRPRQLGKRWEDIVPTMVANDAVQWHFDAGSPGLGISLASGYGDGAYVVRVRRDDEGMIVAAMIEFASDEEDPENDEP